jgi:hypothetical protein
LNLLSNKQLTPGNCGSRPKADRDDREQALPEHYHELHQLLRLWRLRAVACALDGLRGRALTLSAPFKRIDATLPTVNDR